MNILILSRKPNYYSTRRLVAEAKRLGHKATVKDPTTLSIPVSDKSAIRPAIWRDFAHAQQSELHTPNCGVVIPRIGTYALEYSLALLEHLRSQGARIINQPEAIAMAKNKFLSLLRLSQFGLPVPPTVMVRTTSDVPRIIKRLGGLPVIIKLLKGAQGTGVMLGIRTSIVKSILRATWALDYDAMLQKYIFTKGSVGHNDIRVLVIGGKIIGAIRRYAKSGEFRTNIHCGGRAERFDLPTAYKPIVLKATKASGLDIAGVDLIESDDGPVILEINSSPGFEGLEKVTGLNIARAIIRFATNSHE
jgi:ribosomal protein S6--L-glutamate ligase